MISKANCHATNSSKKWTNEFAFTTMRHVFVRFLEEIEDSRKAFRNYLTFSTGWNRRITKLNWIPTFPKSYTFSASRWADAMYIKGEEKRKYYLSSLSPPKNSLRPKKKNWIQRTEAAEHRINLAEKKWRRSIATGQWPQIIQKHQVPIETWVYWFMWGVSHKSRLQLKWESKDHMKK